MKISSTPTPTPRVMNARPNLENNSYLPKSQPMGVFRHDSGTGWWSKRSRSDGGLMTVKINALAGELH
jgi:hypothetical protein